MQKIFELGTKELVTGIAPTSQMQNGGIFHRAKGITIARNMLIESNDVGTLQGAPTPVDITAGVIRDVVLAGVLDSQPSTGTYYAWDKDGNLYSINLIGDNNPVRINPGSAFGASANGLFLIEHTDGTKKLYYFRESDLGYYGDLNATPSFHTAEYSSGVVTTPHHPTHTLFDRTYFGNGRYIGTAYDNGSSGLTFDAHALDFENDYLATCIDDDGLNIVAGITRTTGNEFGSGFSVYGYGNSKIIFWDGNQSSWQREWNLPGEIILGIRRIGSALYAITARRIYQFSYNTPPEPLDYTFTTAQVPSPDLPSQNAVATFKDALFFGGEDIISSFGKLTPSLPRAYMQPFYGLGDGNSVVFIDPLFKFDQMLVSNSAGKLYQVNFDGQTQTGVSAETIYIELGTWWQIGRVVLEFEGALASADQMSIQMQPDSDAAIKDWGTASFAANGSISSKELYNSINARKLKVIMNFDGGAIKVRSLQVWGDRIATPTNS